MSDFHPLPIWFTRFGFEPDDAVADAMYAELDALSETEADTLRIEAKYIRCELHNMRACSSCLRDAFEDYGATFLHQESFYGREGRLKRNRARIFARREQQSSQ